MEFCPASVVASFYSWFFQSFGSKQNDLSVSNVGTICAFWWLDLPGFKTELNFRPRSIEVRIGWIGGKYHPGRNKGIAYFFFNEVWNRCTETFYIKKSIGLKAWDDRWTEFDNNFLGRLVQSELTSSVFFKQNDVKLSLTGSDDKEIFRKWAIFQNQKSWWLDKQRDYHSKALMECGQRHHDGEGA